MPIESVMPSNHLILCRPLLLLPPIFPSIRVFSKTPVVGVLFWQESCQGSPPPYPSSDLCPFPPSSQDPLIPEEPLNI